MATGDAALTQKMIAFQAELADVARAKAEKVRNPSGGAGFR